MAKRTSLRILDRLETAEVLDRPGDAVEPVVERLVGGGVRQDLATGRWLGHPAHPAVVLVPTSCWLGAGILDAAGGAASRRAAQRLTGLGVLAALPAAVSGAADWLHTSGAERRVGTVHAAGNMIAIGAYATSWVLRLRQRRRSAVLAGAIGGAMIAATGYLGGHLAYRRGVGVNTTAFDAGPEEWTRLPLDSEPAAGEMRTAGIDGVALLVTGREGGGPPVVMEDRCTHRGAPLHEGHVGDACVTCPWHGSRFALDTGAVRRGPASMGQPVYEARRRGDGIEVRRTEHGGLRANPVGPADLDQGVD